MVDRIGLERSYWNEAALDPEVDIKYISDISTEECLEALMSDLKHHHILEIGCGVGRLTSRLCTSSKYGCCQIHGIDISQKMLDLAQKNTPWKPDVRYKLTDGRTIPEFECCKEFDSVYSVLLFQHLEGSTIEGYMKEASRVLKPGGVFRFQYISGIEQEPFSRHYSSEQMRKWIKNAGLTFVKEDKGLCHFQWSWITARKAEQ